VARPSLRRGTQVLTALAFAASVLAVTAPLRPASAASSAAQSGESTTTTPSKKTRHSRVVRPKVEKSGSGESTAERDRRLKRECRGMPNAGACLGYAR